MRIYLLSLLLFLFQLTNAESPRVLQWGGIGDEDVSDVLTSTSGATYITGTFTGSLIIADETYESKGAHDLFLTKLDGSMKPVWTKVLHSPADVSEGQLAFGPKGEIIWLAAVKGSATLDGQKLSPLNESSWVVVNVHSNGTVQNIQYQEGPPVLGAFDLSYDHEGNGYLLATYRDSEGDGGWTTSLYKWNWAGEPLWSKTFTGARNERGVSLALDANDDPVVLLNFSGTLSFGDASYTSNGNTDFVIARFSPEGALQWAARSRGDAYDDAEALAFDSKGNLFVSGFYTQNAQFGAFTSMAASDRDIFLVKYNTVGKPEWLRTGEGGIGQDNGTALLVANDGIYMTGTYTEGMTFGQKSLGGTPSRNAYLAKYNEDGILKQLKQIEGDGCGSGCSFGSNYRWETAFDRYVSGFRFFRYIHAGGGRSKRYFYLAGTIIPYSWYPKGRRCFPSALF